MNRQYWLYACLQVFFQCVTKGLTEGSCVGWRPQAQPYVTRCRAWMFSVTLFCGTLTLQRVARSSCTFVRRFKAHSILLYLAHPTLPVGLRARGDQKTPPMGSWETAVLERLSKPPRVGTSYAVERMLGPDFRLLPTENFRDYSTPCPWQSTSCQSALQHAEGRERCWPRNGGHRS